MNFEDLKNMNKKEIEEKINNLPKDKYIYQRYNGIMTKYIDDGEYYIDCKTGIGIKKDEHLMLGKVSENIIDLIKDKDIVEIELSEEFVEKKDKKQLIQIGDIYTKETLQKDTDNGIIIRILTILSYNQYMANCYKVGGEDGI